MGKKITGECDCGYVGEAHIASGRAQHGKVFNYPHHCNSCDSLISIDVLCKYQICNQCGSTDVKSYKSLTKTLSHNSFLSKLSTDFLLKIGYHRSDVVHEETFCYPLKKKFVLLCGDHYCPKCKSHSMRFTTSMLYD